MGPGRPPSRVTDAPPAAVPTSHHSPRNRDSESGEGHCWGSRSSLGPSAQLESAFKLLMHLDMTQPDSESIIADPSPSNTVTLSFANVRSEQRAPRPSAGQSSA